MNNYRKLFAQISPSESDEQLIRKVMARKAENMKDNDSQKTTKRFLLRKAVIIPTAAALAIGAATLSVGAANNWDYSNPFKNMYAQKYEGNVTVNSDVHSVVLPTSDPASQSTASKVEKVDYNPERPIGTFDFEKYGKPLDIVMEGDGVTATLNGMLAYDSECCIMYTLTATDEAIAKNNGKVPMLDIDFGHFGFKIDGKIAGGMGYTGETLLKEGNTRTGLIKVHSSSADLSGKTLNITFLVEADDGTHNGTVLLKETKDILVDFPIAENIEKTLDLDLKTDSFEGKINKLKIESFNAFFYYEGDSNIPTGGALGGFVKEDAAVDQTIASYTGEDLAEKDTPYEALYDELEQLGDAVLTLKDGTTVVAKYNGISANAESHMKGVIRLQYTYPVATSDIVTITFGEYTINL